MYKDVNKMKPIRVIKKGEKEWYICQNILQMFLPERKYPISGENSLNLYWLVAIIKE